MGIVSNWFSYSSSLSLSLFLCLRYNLGVNLWVRWGAGYFVLVGCTRLWAHWIRQLIWVSCRACWACLFSQMFVSITCQLADFQFLCRMIFQFAVSFRAACSACCFCSIVLSVACPVSACARHCMLSGLFQPAVAFQLCTVSAVVFLVIACSVD